jgi:hypothetical protein
MKTNPEYSPECGTFKVWRSCIRKIGYSTRRRAKKAIDDTRRRPGFSGGTLGAYHCKECNLWHVGTSPKSKKQAARRELKHQG